MARSMSARSNKSHRLRPWRSRPMPCRRRPRLSSAALSGSAVNLTWTGPDEASPTTASGYLIDESTDGTHFQPGHDRPRRRPPSLGGRRPGPVHHVHVPHPRLQWRRQLRLFRTPPRSRPPNQAAGHRLFRGLSPAPAAALILNGVAILNGTKSAIDSEHGPRRAGSALRQQPGRRHQVRHSVHVQDNCRKNFGRFHVRHPGSRSDRARAAPEATWASATAAAISPKSARPIKF